MGNELSSSNESPKHGAALELHFIHRSMFDSESPLPRFDELPQHLKRVETFLMKLLFFGSDARTGLSSFLLISHRWEGRCHPDASQEQRKAIAEWLSQNLDKEWVWFDYCSLPQDFKNEKGDVVKAMGPEDKAYFRHVLAHIDYAYLLFDVLIVYDQDYMTRFWCLYEAFLAMHSIVGGVIAQIERREAEKRSRVVCVGMVAQKGISGAK